MSKKCYFAVFLTLAFIFVPVYFTIGVSSFSGPCCYVALSTLWLLVGDPGAFMLALCVTVPFLAVYTALFYAGAWVTYEYSTEMPGSVGRAVCQALVFLALISCSFLRLIHAAYFMNDTGTYDFWSASVRLLQR